MNIKRIDGTGVTKDFMLSIIYRILLQTKTVESDQELESIAKELETWVITQ